MNDINARIQTIIGGLVIENAALAGRSSSYGRSLPKARNQQNGPRSQMTKYRSFDGDAFGLRSF